MIIHEVMHNKLKPFGDTVQPYLEVKMANNPDFRPLIDESLVPAWAQAMMRACWSAKPVDRPSFAQIMEQIPKE